MIARRECDSYEQVLLQNSTVMVYDIHHHHEEQAAWRHRVDSRTDEWSSLSDRRPGMARLRRAARVWFVLVHSFGQSLWLPPTRSLRSRSASLGSTSGRSASDEGATVHRGVFVCNVGWRVDPAALRDEMARFGEVVDVRLEADQNNPRRHRGLGTVIFATPDAARDAVQSAASRDGPRLMGRPLTIRKLTTHDPDRSKAKRDPNRPALFAQLRRTRRLSDVEQILASVTLYTVKEFNMAITALGRVREWQRALEFLDEMRRLGLEPTVVSYNAAISACGKGEQWRRALDLLDEMRQNQLDPDVISYSAAMSACEKGAQWERALDLLRAMRIHGLEPNVISYNAAISACQKGGQWERALALLDEMKAQRRIEPDVISYSATIAACETGSQWERALELMGEMGERGLRPNVISYTAAISACGKSGQWKRALELLGEMREVGLEPDTISYCAAITACEKGEQWELALELLRQMTELGLSLNVISYSAVILACEKSSQWERALELFGEMQRRGIEPDVMIYNTAILACRKGSQYDRAFELMVEMRERRARQHVASYNEAIAACEKDLQWERGEHKFMFVSLVVFAHSSSRTSVRSTAPRGPPSKVICFALFSDSCGKCRSFVREHAKIFERSQSQTRPFDSLPHLASNLASTRAARHDAERRAAAEHLHLQCGHLSVRGSEQAEGIALAVLAGPREWPLFTLAHVRNKRC